MNVDMGENSLQDLPAGCLTDVPGVQVGHAQRMAEGWLTGVSVVIPPQGTIGAADVRGGGPGTHETDAIKPGTLVSTVNAVTLSGGSAYGLVAARGVQRFCEEQGNGFQVPGGVVPIVPAATIFDLGRGGDFSARPDEQMGYDAAAAASSGPVARGNVGAGTGAVIAAQQFKGGVGTASMRMDGANSHIVIGALAVVNALGMPLHALAEAPAHRMPPGAAGTNTTLVVVATNATIDVAAAARMATVGHNGLARALDPVHTLADGDTVFSLATCQETFAQSADAQAGDGMVNALIELQSLAATVTQAAIEDGIRAAESITTPAGNFPHWPH